jgi:hypothetical protein
MAAKIHRLRPKRHDRVAEALQLVLELPLDLEPPLRVKLADALSTFTPSDWPFFMVSRAEARDLLYRIVGGPRPKATLAVWVVAMSYAEPKTGVVEATREQIAAVARTEVAEVSRALSRLADLGALVRLSRGRYMVNPAASWVGPLINREAAVRKLEPVG